MRSEYLPVILLLGAKSVTNPLASIPAELSSLKALFEAHQADADIPPFAIQYEPYFTKEQIKTTLDQLAGKIAILHFAGHSDGGVLLSDDQAVNTRQVAAHISTWPQPPDLIFINGCHNAGQVEAFHAVGVPLVIATHRAINDTQAAGFAREFYASLLTNGGQASLQAAFKQAGSKVLLSDTRQARSLDIRELRQDDAQDWDWSLFPRDPQALEWTLRDLLTHERPRFDEKGELINPYRGLEAFREEDRAYFFGREALTGELCEKIPANRLFALWGASGSGKSSLVSAGVIPQLREAGDWLILKTRPGNDPFRLLATEIARVFHPDIRANRDQETSGLIEQLKNATLYWPDKVADLLQTCKNQRLLLFIDQFEELFTQSDAATVRAYEEQLVRLVEADLPNCTLLLVMRADFLSTALAYETFAKLLDKSPAKLLPPMGQAELRAAIEQPARKQRVTVEPTLTEALLDDVENQPGSLPLLQYVLSLLWDQRGDSGLLLGSYNRFGGLEKALEVRANSILNDFSATEQEQTKHIFLRLIQPGEGSEDTRRRTDLREFGDDPATTHILKVLADARLITTQKDEHDNNAFAEVSHEALIQHWGKLREWVADNRDALRTQYQLSKGAKDWDDNGRNTDWLLTGSRLAVAQEWLKLNSVRASKLEATFVGISIQEQDRLTLEKEQVRKRNRNVLASFVAVLVIVTSTAIWQWLQTHKSLLEANYNLAKAYEEKLNSELDKWEKSKETKSLQKAWLYALEAQKLDLPTKRIALKPESFSRLSIFTDSEVSPEHKQIPTSDLSSSVNALIYSPDGKVFASGSDDGAVRLWNAYTGEHLKTLQGHSERINALAYSPPTGKTLISGSDDNTVRMWDACTGALLKTLQGHTGPVNAVAFSPDGKVIASGSKDMKILLWDVHTGKLLKTLQGNITNVWALAYNLDGKIIVSGSSSGAIRSWDAHTGDELKSLEGHPNPRVERTNPLAGEELNYLKDLSYPHLYPSTEGTSPLVRTLAYSPDGKVLASGSFDDTVRLWDVTTGKLLKILQGHTGWVRALAYSPDGNVIATASLDRTVRLWDAHTGKLLKTLQGHTGGVRALAYSPNGKVITSSASDNTVRLWDTGTGEILKVLQRESTPHLNNALAYSPDGKVLASASDNTIQLRDMLTGNLLKTLQGHKHKVMALTYSPDGKVIASGSGSRSDDNTVRLWDAITGSPLKTLQSHAVTTLAYSPNGKVIVSGSVDNTVRLWNSSTGILLKVLGKTPNDLNLNDWSPVMSVRYNPDGKVIVTSGLNGRTVKIWEPHMQAQWLLHDFDPIAASDALSFLWQMKLDELEFRPEAEKGYTNFTNEYRKYRKLLDAPKPDETKLDQVVRFLETECAYKDPDKKNKCKSNKQ